MREPCPDCRILTSSAPEPCPECASKRRRHDAIVERLQGSPYKLSLENAEYEAWLEVYS